MGGAFFSYLAPVLDSGLLGNELVTEPEPVAPGTGLAGLVEWAYCRIWRAWALVGMVGLSWEGESTGSSLLAKGVWSTSCDMVRLCERKKNVEDLLHCTALRSQLVRCVEVPPLHSVH